MSVADANHAPAFLCRARFEADGVISANAPKLDITGSSLNLDPKNPSRLDVRLQPANLSSLPNATDGILGGSYVDYLTSWNYHIPGNTEAKPPPTPSTWSILPRSRSSPASILRMASSTCLCRWPMWATRRLARPSTASRPTRQARPPRRTPRSCQPRTDATAPRFFKSRPDRAPPLGLPGTDDRPSRRAKRRALEQAPKRGGWHRIPEGHADRPARRRDARFARIRLAGRWMTTPRPRPRPPFSGPTP